MDGTFGQGLPGYHVSELIPAGEVTRIIMLTEDDAYRSNVGVQNATDGAINVTFELYDAMGNLLDTVNRNLAPYSNTQINQILDDSAPVQGYVDVSATGTFFTYGSVLDNMTSDPTTILPF